MIPLCTSRRHFKMTPGIHFEAQMFGYMADHVFPVILRNYLLQCTPKPSNAPSSNLNAHVAATNRWGHWLAWRVWCLKIVLMLLFSLWIRGHHLLHLFLLYLLFTASGNATGDDERGFVFHGLSSSATSALSEYRRTKSPSSNMKSVTPRKRDERFKMKE